MRTGQRLVHLDMKGGPARPGHLVQLLPVLAEWGATGLLLEWEDMFPWRGRLASIGRQEAFTMQQVILSLRLMI